MAKFELERADIELYAAIFVFAGLMVWGVVDHLRNGPKRRAKWDAMTFDEQYDDWLDKQL